MAYISATKRKVRHDHNLTGSHPDVTVERRTIDHIPEDERHGKGRDLFTVWFGSNIMLLTIITGALLDDRLRPTTVGRRHRSAHRKHRRWRRRVVLHAAQGPQMAFRRCCRLPSPPGRTEAFSSSSRCLHVPGFFASNAVLGGKALASVTGMPTNLYDLSDRV